MSKNLLKIFSVCCLVAIILLSLTSCKNTPQDNETQPTGVTYHTITFNTNGAAPIEPILVQHNHFAQEPPIPQLDNHVFLRWDYNNGNTWFFDSKRVKSDLQISVIWISAESLFSVEPVDNGLSLTEIKRQEEFFNLLVPSVINGKTVVAVSDNAFDSISESYAESMVFPSTVTSIGKSAFSRISKVAISFEGPIYKISESSFEKCTTLKEIKLGNGMETIPFSAFASCTALNRAQIPDSVKIIEENAYEKCSSLLTVVLPSSLTTIENGAFLECNSLKSIFFKGSEEQFDLIDIADGNDPILTADLYFYSEEKPSTQGDFWHYDSNGTPVIW